MHLLAVVFILLETDCLAPCIYFKPLFCYIYLVFSYVYYEYSSYVRYIIYSLPIILSSSSVELLC